MTESQVNPALVHSSPPPPQTPGHNSKIQSTSSPYPRAKHHTRHSFHGLQLVSPQLPASFLPQHRSAQLPYPSAPLHHPLSQEQETNIPRPSWTPPTRNRVAVARLIPPAPIFLSGAIPGILPNSLQTRKIPCRSIFGVRSTTSPLGGGQGRRVGNPNTFTTCSRIIKHPRAPTVASTKRPSRYRTLRRGKSAARKSSSRES